MMKSPMQTALTLPPGVAVGILAFLLALIPAGLFLWLGYLRRTDRPVPSHLIAQSFLAGLIIVLPAYWLEKSASNVWYIASPATAHNFHSATLPLQHWYDVLLPAFGAFVIVAIVEEGLRYAFLRIWLHKQRAVDQVFDGLIIGLAVGLGFATLENAWYFIDLLQRENFDTLVVVFFLRFLISTLLHASLGGIMGVMMTQGMFSLYWSHRYYRRAFLVPWFTHGTFDLLLAIDLSVYAVLLLLPPLLVMTTWLWRRDFLMIQRKEGRFLFVQEAPTTNKTHLIERFLHQLDSPWNIHAPWLQERQKNALLQQLEREARE
jgi:RsiW-degrading membrane proteinase PrsW (M82 family)